MKTAFRELTAEYKRIFLDPGAVLILVVALVLYAFFYPIPYSAKVLKEVPVVVVDLDQSDLSRRLVRMLDADDLATVAAEAKSLEEAESSVREGRAGGVLVVPADFERRIRRGEQATVAAYTDASYFLVYRQVLTGVLEATGTLSAGIEVRRLVAQGMPAERAMKARDPLPLVTRPLFNAAEGYDAYVVPAVLVLILQQTLLVGIGTVRGTARQQKGAAQAPVVVARPPVAVAQASVVVAQASVLAEPRSSSLSRLLGKAMAYYTLYLVHALFYFGIVYKLFGFPQRASALLLFEFVTPFLLAVTFLGLAARSAFRTREMAIQVLLFTSLPALFVSGFAWPSESLPRWLATLARALPSTEAIPGVLRLTQMGASLPDVRAEWLTLWALCGVYFAMAWASEWWEIRATGASAPARPQWPRR